MASSVYLVFLLLLINVQAWDSDTLLLYGGLVEDMYKQMSMTVPRQAGEYTINSNLFTTEKNGKSYAEGSTWIGYVGISESRRDIAVVFRGTLHPAEWAKNLALRQVSFPYTNGSSSGSPHVHEGFLRLYTDSDSGGASLRQQLMEELTKLLESNSGYSVTITGHSLGGALCILSAFDIANSVLTSSGAVSRLSVYTFASPMVGNEEFKEMVEGTPILANILRVTDVRDIVPYLPSLNYERAGEELNVDGCKFSYPDDKNSKGFVAKVKNYHSMKRYLHTVSSLKQSRAEIKERKFFSPDDVDESKNFVKDIINAAKSAGNDVENLVTDLEDYVSNFSKPCGA